MQCLKTHLILLLCIPFLARSPDLDISHPCLSAVYAPVYAEEADQVIDEQIPSNNSRMPYRTNELTKEQEDEGWVLFGGYAYPPEAAGGQSGETVEKKMGISERDVLTRVIFRADVQAGITEPVIVYFANAATYREYYVELYASAGYETAVNMVPGTYYFTHGGPENDMMDVFSIVSPDTFTVQYRDDLIVRPVIRSRGNIVQVISGVETESNEPETLEVPESVSAKPEEKTDDTPWQVYLMWSAIMFGLAGVIIAIWYVRRRIRDRYD